MHAENIHLQEIAYLLKDTGMYSSNTIFLINYISWNSHINHGGFIIILSIKSCFI